MTELSRQVRPIILQPGEGWVIPGPEGVTLKATAEQTAGAIGFVEATSAPGFAAPRHIHHANDELFYVLEGEFQFLVGEETVNAPAGSFVYIPRGTVHAPKVVSSSPGKVVFAYVPGGLESDFEEFERVARKYGSLDTPEALLEVQAIAARGNSEFVGPPM